MARFPLYGTAGIGIAAAIGFVLILGSIGSSILPRQPETTIVSVPTGPEGPTALPVAFTQNINKFASADELRNYLANVEANRLALSLQPGAFAGANFSFVLTDAAETQAAPPLESAVPEASRADQDAGADYSTTNIQVAGVDEPDFVKNDGKYAYILSGDKLTIAEVFPTDSANIVSKIGVDIKDGQYLQNMFLSGDKLVIFYQEYGEEPIIPAYDFEPQPVYSPKTHALVLDVSDRADPKVFKNYAISGAYSNSRMIGDFVYLVTTSEIYDYRQPLVPKVAESDRTVVMPDIYYFDNPEPYYSFNTVTSVDITRDEDAVISKTFMMNPAATLYVSEKNIYIAYQKYRPYIYETSNRDRFFEAVLPLLPADVQEEIRSIDADKSLSPSEKWDRISTVLQDMYNRMDESEKAGLLERIRKAVADYDERTQRDALRTVVHKIEIMPAGNFEYVTRGEVPGRLLNQFSMDEDGNRFRIATTVEYYSRFSSGLYNSVYVLDEDMKTVGALEKIAPGESIYSARFIGDRLYLVTFRQVDPFFVIDLSSDPPEVLGALKLPGFSNYLHPYDKDHIIGIGRETKASEFGGVQIQGLKLALFNVEDVGKPRLVDQYEIGGPGTDSEVLFDHKALLFDRAKNVLSIPVTSYDTEPRYAEDSRYIPPQVWRGFYVFGVSPQDGFELKGKVEHSTSSEYYYGLQGSRSFYIDDVLYTVSLNNLIKMNDIQTLEEMGRLEIGSTGGIIKYPEPYVE
jgi:uncharacterized secreted protein with C-terminal beta-propeller domain